MIKTLRITSIVAVVLAVVIFVFSVSYGFRSDENIKEFLNLPGVIEKFTAAEGQRAQASNSQISPLVQQARAFALYLNPPAPNVPKNLQAGHGPGKIGTQLNVTPKFKVIGTSYYEQRPELSLALIDEPGKGIHWVKQSTTVGHLYIEQVKDGLVIVKSGTETFELIAEHNPPKTTSSSSVNVPKKPFNTVSSKPSVQKPPSRDRNLGKREPSKVQKVLNNIERDEKLDELYENLKKIQRNSDFNTTDSEFNEKEKARQIEKLISNFKASYVSPEEAKKLEDFGEQLKNYGWEPNHIPSEDQ